jgi:hypothetical protein
MKKLTALIAVLFVGSALSLGACKKDEKKDEGKGKTTEPAKKEEPKKEEPAKEEPKKEEPAAGGAASTGLADCDAYVAAMDKYLQCDKIPQATRDAAKQGMDAMKQGWGDTSALPDDVKKQANDACKQSVDALKQGATALGCTL